jgi:hypothetical protein
MSQLTEFGTLPRQSMHVFSDFLNQAWFLLAQNVTVVGIQNVTWVYISVFARRQKFKLHSYWLRMSHHVEYRTLLTQISVPVSAARKTWSRFHHPKRCFILKHSHQDQNNHLLVRALREKATCLPQSSLSMDDDDAVHTAFSLSTLYILPSPATSMELQRHDVLKGLYGMLAFLPASVACRKLPCCVFVLAIVQPNINITIEK